MRSRGQTPDVAFADCAQSGEKTIADSALFQTRMFKSPNVLAEIGCCFVRRRMARRRRVFVPGASVHVTQRGNNRGPTFGDDEDFQLFLAYLRESSETRGLAVHGYGLMDTHYHLLVTPKSATALARTIQHFGGRYVQNHNRKYDRTGTLWDGRYHDKVVGDDRYFFTCLRYIEHNPVTAGIVKTPEAYRWSSYRVHAYGEPSEWLVPHPLYLGLGVTCEERQIAYRAICAAVSE
jgi:putative transposase